MNNYSNNNHNSNGKGNDIFQKIKECESDKEHLARLTEEGYVCSIKGLHCPNQKPLAKNYTCYYYCEKKNKAFKYPKRYGNKMDI